MDFFEHSWGYKKVLLEKKILKINNEQTSAIILACNLENYERFFSLPSFKELLDNLNCEMNIYYIQLLQASILSLLATMQINKNKVLQNLKILNEEITLKNYAFLKEFLENIEISEQAEQEEEKVDLFHSNISILNEISQELLALNLKEADEKIIKEASFSANNSLFIISLTGIINAGKSSLLNALLERKILGTANIPETVNLTYLTYSEEEYAEVEFSDFTRKKIKLDEIQAYTSAKFEQNVSINLVKLGLNNDFLKANISVIDTPGIDDNQIEREELTKAHMKKSDFIIHLMNASQSATRKDIDFIVSTLKSSKTSGFCIVLTHIDALAAQDLEEVINYTKRAIKEELQASSFPESLLENVDFFGVDSKSGKAIKEFKNYLLKNLFSNNSQKTAFILTSYKKELLKVTNSLIKEKEYKESQLFKSSKELLEEDKILKEKLSKIQASLSEINSDLQAAQKRLDLEKILDMKSLNFAFENIISRIILDAKYSKDRKLPLKEDRIKNIVQGAFSDALSDFTRSFEGNLRKNFTNILENLKAKFELFSSLELEEFDLRNFLQNEVKKIDLTPLKEEFLVKLRKFDSLTSLKTELLQSLHSFIEEIQLRKLYLNLAESSLAKFLASLKEALQSYEKEQKEKAENLAKILAQVKENQEASGEEVRELKEALASLHQIKKRILAC